MSEARKKPPLKNVKSVVLAGNGTNDSLGCEAILRGTTQVISDVLKQKQFSNVYFKQENGAPNKNEKGIQHTPISLPARFKPDWFKLKLLETANREFYRTHLFKSLEPHLGPSQAVLSIGGDNYSQDYGTPKLFLEMNKYIHENHCPTILWGSSVGPFSDPKIEKAVADNFNQCVTAIFVREKRSQGYLKSIGCESNVHLMADPAFVMEPVRMNDENLEFPLPSNAIGLNLSPLAGEKSGLNSKEWLKTCGNLVKEIRRQFNFPVVLIPHDLRPHSNDYFHMKGLYEEIKGGDKGIYMIPSGLTAAETKWVISKLKCLIAARTHATIAAFSSGVPALSIAYSVKAWGINEMVFGHTDYVVDIKSISVEGLVEKIKTLLKREGHERKRLAKRLPSLRQSVYDAAKTLKEILKY